MECLGIAGNADGGTCRRIYLQLCAQADGGIADFLILCAALWQEVFSGGCLGIAVAVSEVGWLMARGIIEIAEELIVLVAGMVVPIYISFRYSYFTLWLCHFQCIVCKGIIRI